MFADAGGMRNPECCKMPRADERPSDPQHSMLGDKKEGINGAVPRGRGGTKNALCYGVAWIAGCPMTVPAATLPTCHQVSVPATCR